jgi:hypothetical protein
VSAALWLLDRPPVRQRMVCTAFMEHFTAVLAEELPREDGDFRENIHPELADLWLWHALEELEHKSVTYQVYELIGNRRIERLLAEPAGRRHCGPGRVGLLGDAAGGRAGVAADRGPVRGARAAARAG